MTEKKHIIFDSQILNSVQLCALRTNYYLQKNLRMPEVPVPLETGDLLHKMLECYYLNIKEHGTEVIYDNDNFNKLIDTCVGIGEAHSVTLSLQPSEVEETIFHFTEYTKHTRMDGLVVKEVEQAFISQIYDSPDLAIYYSGKIDLIADVPNFGDSVIDHKSMRRYQPPEPLSNQFTGYSFCTKIKTVIVNKIGFQKSLKPEDRFKRDPIIYTEDMWFEWQKDTIWWARQYAYFIQFNEWPRNRTSCDKYGGCLFQRICNANNEEAREWLIKTAYVVGEEWDPTAVLNKDKAKETTNDPASDVKE